MKRVATLVGALALAGCGGGDARPDAPDPFVAVEPGAVLGPEELEKAAPRWQVLTQLEDTGPATRTLAIPGRSIQWRIRWRCREGSLKMRVEGDELVEGSCPGKGEATAVRGGRLALAVEATGPWTAVVEHQVDSPLQEPPLPGMVRPIARGAMQPLERQGQGRVLLYRLRGGRLALRLERFRTSASSDLEVWVSPARRPRTSAAAMKARHVSVAPLKATAGSHNYLLPRGMRPRDVRSVILWCEPLLVAYASAGLR